MRAAGLRLGVDPLGGASLGYWPRIAERYGLDLTVVNPALDPTFALHDASTTTARSAWTARARRRWRGWCSSRTGIGWPGATIPMRTATASSRRRAGLLNPNHYLAVAIHYLLTHRPEWPRERTGRQDAGLERADRPRGGRPGPRAARGAGRLQVVRAGAVRRELLLRRRRERRAPASCGATAASGPPTRTACCSACWRPRSRR